MDIIFFGTSTIAAHILASLNANERFFVRHVVTQPPSRVGRRQVLTPSNVMTYAQENNIPFMTPDSLKNNDELHTLIEQYPDAWYLVVEYGQFIPSGVLTTPKNGFLNIHPSLLPKYRGPSPIQYALLHGEEKTGTTLMQLDAEMDHGPILAQKEVLIDTEDGFLTLRDKLIHASILLLEETFPLLVAGKITEKPQNHDAATVTKLLTKADGRIDWASSAHAIYNKIRAFEAWPQAWCELKNKKRLKILKALPYNENDVVAQVPGTIIVHNKKILVACDKGFLELITVQPEGKKEMSASSFINGYQAKILY